MPSNLTEFGLAEMLRCSREMHRAASGAPTMEECARRLCRSLYDELRGVGVPVCVSGAGPSLLAFELPGRAAPEPGEAWQVLRPPVRPAGAELLDS